MHWAKMGLLGSICSSLAHELPEGMVPIKMLGPDVNVGEEYSIKLIRHCQWINFSEGFGNKSWIFGAKG